MAGLNPIRPNAQYEDKDWVPLSIIHAFCLPRGRNAHLLCSLARPRPTIDCFPMPLVEQDQLSPITKRPSRPSLFPWQITEFLGRFSGCSPPTSLQMIGPYREKIPYRFTDGLPSFSSLAQSALPSRKQVNGAKTSR